MDICCHEGLLRPKVKSLKFDTAHNQEHVRVVDIKEKSREYEFGGLNFRRQE